ncbi:MAG TPA: tripartite tricarboxylate transporter permease [Stellaceae bacterium]|nr:tripartite tricarboxylate transporter permease [Stellaceae bacterium]
MLDVWLSGFESLLHVQELVFLTVGMAVGLIAGVVPGLGPTTALALLIPLTYGMQPITALALSAGVMGAAPMGGSIAAILLNAPGAAPNAATCLDGYPLSQQGKAGLAIGAAASANSIGGIIGTVSVLLVLPLAKQLILLFGPPEFFLLGMLGLAVVASASRGKMLRALVAGVFGLMISCVGYDQVTGVVRYTFGIPYLWDGIHLVPALIGLFAVAEMINLWVKGGTIAKDARNVKITRMMAGLIETFRHWPTVLRGSLIGTVIGAIPGAGGVVAAFVSYSMTVQVSKNPDSFGKGNIQGVIAPEAAINAKDSSSLIPTLAFGIPGSAEMAVFLGILVLHGLQPGPLLLIQNQTQIYGLIWALTAACILASCLGLLLTRPLARVTLLPSTILVPSVLTVALIGSWAVDQTIENVIVTLAFGVIGHLMSRLDYPRLPIVISLVLGSTIERDFFQSMMIADGSWRIFLTRPVSLILLALVVLALAATPGRVALGWGSARLRRPRKERA